ncbi:epimerase [Nocardiopsis sp. LOL_012]|uniref:epimerase n=1 Tax=Nocardiopsis sp. LOL_012 TaxID=3345409 RepID=UPI003A8A213A
MARVAVVTGVSAPFAARVAQILAEAPGVHRVIGADSVPPLGGEPPGGVEYAHVDLHDESLARIVSESGADLVLHLGLDATQGHGREEHLLGAMRALTAAQRSSCVRRLVVRSSAALEDGGAEEVERHTLGLLRRRPDMSVAVLRFANLIGPTADTPLTRYLDSPVVPTVLGHDPDVRFLHEDDAVEAAARMALSDETGLFDLAGEDSVPLSECLRKVGGRRMPVPAAGLRVLRGLNRHGRIGYASSSAPRMGTSAPGEWEPAPLEHALRWAPEHSSPQAFESYAAHRRRARAGLRAVHLLTLARAGLRR